VSVAPSFATRWLMPRLHHFFAIHPKSTCGYRRECGSSTRGGQASAAERTTIGNWLEESDLAILYGHGDYPGYRVDKLFALTVCARSAARSSRTARIRCGSRRT